MPTNTVGGAPSGTVDDASYDHGDAGSSSKGKGAPPAAVPETVRVWVYYGEVYQRKLLLHFALNAFVFHPVWLCEEDVYGLAIFKLWSSAHPCPLPLFFYPPFPRSYPNFQIYIIPIAGEPPAANHRRLRASGLSPAAGPPRFAFWLQKRARRQRQRRIHGLRASCRRAGSLQHRARPPQAKVRLVGAREPGGREAADPRALGGASPGPGQGRRGSAGGPRGEARQRVQPPRAQRQRRSDGGHAEIERKINERRGSTKSEKERKKNSFEITGALDMVLEPARVIVLWFSDRHVQCKLRLSREVPYPESHSEHCSLHADFHGNCFA